MVSPEFKDRVAKFVVGASMLIFATLCLITSLVIVSILGYWIYRFPVPWMIVIGGGLLIWLIYWSFDRVRFSRKP